MSQSVRLQHWFELLRRLLWSISMTAPMALCSAHHQSASSRLPYLSYFRQASRMAARSATSANGSIGGSGTG